MVDALWYISSSCLVAVGSSVAALLACVVKLARPRNAFLLRLGAVCTLFAGVVMLHGVIDL